MPVTDEQLTYFYLSQGLAGRPYTLRGSQPLTQVFSAPLQPTVTAPVFTSLATVILKWNTMTDYIQYARQGTGILQKFFYPNHVVNGVNSLAIASYNTQGDSINIVALDANDNYILDKGTAPPQLIYNQWCTWENVPGVREEMPVYLILRCDANTNQAYFSYASEFSPALTRLYPAMKNFYVDLAAGATIDIDILRLMVDESMLPDDDGGAPTGDEDGGGGLFDYPFTPIGEPALPTVSICDTGMISLYTVSPSDMYQLAKKLWSQNFFDTIIKNFQSPMDNIVSLHVVPFNVYAATQANIIIGNYDTEIPSNILSTTYFDIDCGIIELTGAYQTFADYAPFTNLALYLPYIGIVPISPDDIMDGAINVKYHIDVFSGACVAFVMSLKRGQWTVLNQYQGNILTQFPITGADYTNVYVGAMQVANTAIQTGMQIATAPSAVNAVSNGLNGITQGFSQAMQAKPSFQRSGNVTSAAGFMSVQIPYLIITKPNYIQAKDFRALKGYVSNLQCVIGEQSGFISATVNNEKLTGINATDEEKNMIRSLLSEGIYI